jgi:biofilm PGA synthesis protein PgaA
MHLVNNAHHRVRTTAIAAALACSFGALPAVAARPSASDYDRTIAAARAGRYDEALPNLERWSTAYPKTPRYLHDYASVSSWAGQYDRAVGLWDRIERTAPPGYACRAVGYAARTTGKLDVAERAYRRGVDQDARDWDAHAGLALTWLARGEIDRADAYLERRLTEAAAASGRARMPLLAARAEVQEARGAYLDAAATYRDMLAIDANDRAARRGRVRMADRAGAWSLARELSLKEPALFSDEERRTYLHDANTAAIRWGEAAIDAGHGPARFAATDRALESNRAEIATPVELKLDRGLPGRARFDRVVALRDRYRMKEAHAAYREVERDRLDPPAYAKAAAADALLYLERPAEAVPLYREAIAMERRDKRTPPPTWRSGLVYALIESERHKEARAEADALVKDTAPRLHRGVSGLDRANPEYTDALTLQALTRLYGDSLAESHAMLADVRRRAPFNAGARDASAALAIAREHTEAAREQYAGVVTDVPDHVSARSGFAVASLALQDYPTAARELTELERQYPENKSVQDGVDQWRTWQRPYLSVESGFGRGSSVNDVAGGHDFSLDTKLYSSPLSNNWRALGHWYFGYANLPGGTVTRNRAGVGLDYRRDRLDLEAEIHHTDHEPDRTGGAVGAGFRFSDAWRATASYDSNATDLPLVAYQNGIAAKAGRLAVTRTVDESRRFDASANRYAFTDGNDRTGANLSWTERWVSGPVYKLDTTLSADGSRNTRTDAPYFNPRRDRTYEIAVTNEWLTWRRYKDWFKQSLILSAGTYRQDGFDGGGVAGIRYEHTWQRGYGFDVQYGLGWLRRPYDGLEQNRVYGFFNLHWHIQ